MFEWLVGNTVWQLVSQSDTLSQMVLFSLLGMSVVCWTVFLYKLVLIRMHESDLRKAAAQLQNLRTIDEVQILTSTLSGTVPGHFLSQNIHFFKSVRDSRSHLNQQDWELMQNKIGQTIDSAVIKEESYLPILFTCAAVAPLLGLFGTVWGLIHAFIRISEKQSADITVVAPGIAEALITTLAGLVVAIPALIMYNYLSTRIRHLEGSVVQCADKVSFVLQLALTR